MTSTAIAIIVAGVLISWSLDEIAKAISKNKEKRDETDTD